MNMHATNVPDLRHRTDRYLGQPSGYRAFIPRPLPPAPPIRLEGECQRLLSQTDRALGRLDGSTHTLPNPHLFVLVYVCNESVPSSQIESTPSSLQDLLAAEDKVSTAERQKDLRQHQGNCSDG